MTTKIIKYVGATTDYVGKTIWEIVGNLKDYGVGRIIIRSAHLKYKEPCYFRILSIRTMTNLPPVRRPCFRWPNDHRLLDVNEILFN